MTRVLVADDSETVLLMLRRRLEFSGYEVATATDGREALAAANGDPAPDLILLDAMMPNMSGLEALQSLRAAGNDVPVIVVSAYRYGHEPDEVLQLGADGCLGKPFDWDTLLGEIERLTAT